MQQRSDMEKFLSQSLSYFVNNQNEFHSKIAKGEINAIKLLLDSYFKYLVLCQKEEMLNQKAMKNKSIAEDEEISYEKAYQQFYEDMQQTYPGYDIN